MHPKKIAVFVGSLRTESFNRKMAKALIGLAPETLSLQIIEIGGLPFYNQDIEENPPAAWTEFRNRVRPFDGLLFVTPEYNRSIPAALKNAIDVGSRPYGKSVGSGNPAGIMSVSPGALGGFGANHHLRQCLVFLNVPAMQQPEAYIGAAASLFDQNGDFADDKAKEHAVNFMRALGAWVETLTNAPRR
jgi:chromate reductase, NAD(P)H dehydrogenase (quinone)